MSLMRGNEKAAGSAELPQHWIATVYVLLGVAGILPFLLFEHPRIVDFPNHWARLVIECAAADSPLRQMYRSDLTLVPNMAIDLVNNALCGVVAPRSVLIGTFIVAQVAMLAVAASIQRSLWGRLTPIATLLPALTLNMAAVVGYWNYLAGTALGLTLIAVVLGRRAGPTPWLLVVINIIGVAIFLSHVFAALFTVVLLFAYALSNWCSAAAWPKRVVQAGLFTIAAFLAPLTVAALSERAGGALTFGYFDDDGFFSKSRIVIAPFGGLYPPVDIAVTVAVGVTFIRLLATRTLRVGGAMLMPVVAVIALCIAIPSSFGDLERAIDIDARLAVSAMMVVLASTAIAPHATRAESLVLGLAIVIAVVRWGGVIAEWPRHDRDVRQVRGLLAAIPPGATLISAVSNGTDCPAEPWTQEPYYHLGSFATIDRGAFHALTFAGRGMQPIRVQGRFAEIAASPSTPLPAGVLMELARGTPLPHSHRVAAYAVRWFETYDYVLYNHFGCPPNFAPDRLTLISTGRVSSLLMIRRPGG